MSVTNILSKVFREDQSTMFQIAPFIAMVDHKHKGQLRKNGDPYCNHLHSVSDIASEIGVAIGATPYQLLVLRAAGLGHDLYEDTDTDFEDVAAMTNFEVATIISWVSDDKRLPRKHRHDVYYAQIASSPTLAQAVKVSDVLDNARSALELLDETKHGRAHYGFVKSWLRKARKYCSSITDAAVRSTAHYAHLSEELVLELAAKATAPASF